MLLSFSIQNCLSFFEETTLDLSPTPGLSSHCEHVLGGRDTRAMRLALLFGSNGAGKTCLLRSLSLAIHAVLGNTCAPFAERRFRLSDEALPTKATFFFSAERSKYRYTFETDGHIVLSEALAWVLSDGEERVVFSRNEQGKVTLGAPLAGHVADGGEANEAPSPAEWYRWRTLEPSRFWIRKVEEDGLRGQNVPGKRHLLAVLDFLRGFVFLSGSESAVFGPPQGFFLDGAGFPEFLRELLHWTDVGISDVVQEQLTPNETQQLLQRYDVPMPPPNMPLPSAYSVCDLRERRYLTFRKETADKPIVAYELKGVHNGVSFPFKDESAGTCRLVNLSAALWLAMHREIILVADEFDAFLHPLLAKRLLGELLAHVHGHTQLFLATHCTALLTTDLIRPDEVWMVEKRGSGATDLYPLARFMPRADKRLEKGYLAGVYGAVPIPGSFFRGEETE